MRIWTFVACLLALVVAGANALDATVGAAVGATFAGMIGEDFEDIKQAAATAWLIDYGLDAEVKTEWRMSFVASVFLTLDINRRLALQPEIWYAETHSGMETTFDAYSDVFSYVWVYRMIEVPVLLKARFPMRALGSFGRVRAEGSLYVGPTVLYLLDPPPTLVRDWNYGDEIEDRFGTQDDYRRLAFGVVGGFDLRRHFGALMAGIDVRANWNLSSFDNYGGPLEDDTRMPYIRASLQIGARL